MRRKDLKVVYGNIDGVLATKLELNDNLQYALSLAETKLNKDI